MDNKIAVLILVPVINKDTGNAILSHEEDVKSYRVSPVNTTIPLPEDSSFSTLVLSRLEIFVLRQSDIRRLILTTQVKV